MIFQETLILLIISIDQILRCNKCIKDLSDLSVIIELNKKPGLRR
jgi:hypothetical protein